MSETSRSAAARREAPPAAPDAPPPEGAPPALSAILRARATAKVLADPAAPWPTRGRPSRAAVEALLDAAAWAPFHQPRPEAERAGGPSAVPWRAWALDAPACRALLARVRAAGLGAGIVPDMLAAADALALVTWRPAGGRRAEDDPRGAFDGTVLNLEHAAAGGAMIQSLLLAATAAGHRTYWSSGGALRGGPAWAWLGVPPEELLLGAVFLFPAEGAAEGQEREARPGKWRHARGAVADWATWCDVTPEG